jgi:hypothetical protein
MATRSAIGYALPSGKVRAVYCHWDGYPSHQLPILKEHYNSLPKVRALVKPGSMSSLRTSQIWESDATRDPQPLYHHERGAGPWCAGDGSNYGDPPSTVTEADIEPHWRDYGCEHLYVFRPGYGWFHYEL